MPANRRIRDGK